MGNNCHYFYLCYFKRGFIIIVSVKWSNSSYVKERHCKKCACTCIAYHDYVQVGGKMPERVSRGQLGKWVGTKLSVPLAFSQYFSTYKLSLSLTDTIMLVRAPTYRQNSQNIDYLQYRVLGYLLILVICLFIISFSIGPGPLCFFINAELVGQAARSAAQSCASFMQMFWCVLNLIDT